ncbi:MAG: V-type ATPase subunit [Clostridia bacterium]|nr:V-type ATPase subunit [Clostridia bacterium]
MSVSYAANAVFAKARALYGKRLRRENYNDMLACRTLSELVGYLKTKTEYSSAFENISELDSHQIEELLRVHLLKKLEVLCRYEISAGEDVYKYFIAKGDIDQILKFIRLLILGTPEKYLAALPPFFSSYTEFDLYKVAEARDFGQLLDALNGTPYRKLIEPFENNYAEKGCYLIIESTLTAYLYKYLGDLVDKGTNKKSAAQVHEIINYKADMNTIANIYRLTRLQDADNEIIKNYINTDFTNFTDKELDMLISEQYARDMLRLLPSTYYGKDFAKTDFSHLEGALQQMFYKKLVKGIRYYTSPTAVMFCYFFLAENEVQNIIRIVEGINYNIPPDRINAFLIGTDN